jgi:hypothetical protein
LVLLLCDAVTAENVDSHCKRDFPLGAVRLSILAADLLVNFAGRLVQPFRSVFPVPELWVSRGGLAHLSPHLVDTTTAEAVPPIVL